MLRLGLGWDSIFALWSAVGSVTLWALQWFAYVGILDDSENTSGNKEALVGGASLDLLGLTWLVQFGTVLWTPKMHWLLAILPPWGAWKLYSTFKGGSSSLFGGASAQSTPSNPKEGVTDEKDAKQKKRAERRRQKWS